MSGAGLCVGPLNGPPGPGCRRREPGAGAAVGWGRLNDLRFELADVTALVKQCMENAMALDVPLLVIIGSGHNWVEAH